MRAAPRYFPVFLDLRGRRCVVVGDGAAAEQKVRELLAAGARVVMVARHPGEAMEALSRGSKRLRLRRRAYRNGDLAGAFLAVAAAQGDDLREAVWQEAERRGLPLNSVDDPWRSSWIAGSVMRRGDLAVAISTAGRAPALAVRLRQWLEGVLGEHHARFLELAGTVRAPLAARRPSFEERRDLWYRLVDSDVLDLLRQGDEPAARRRFVEILGVEPGAAAAVSIPVPVAAWAPGAPAAPSTPAPAAEEAR